MNKGWLIELKAPFGGLIPSYYDSSLFYGGNNQFAQISQSISFLNPDVLTQGKNGTALTNGTQAGNVSNSVAHFSNPTATGKIYAVGENSAFPITTSTVGTRIDIDNGGSEDATACVVAGAYAYVFYSKGASGDIARITVASEAIDPDWGSTVPTGAAALQGSVSFSAILAEGAGKIYFTNGQYVGYYDYINDILDPQALDFQANSVAVDLVWDSDVVSIAVNNPDISAVNTYGRIYTWVGNESASSYQEPIIDAPGKIGSLLVKNGVKFVFYDNVVDSRFCLGYVGANSISEVASFSGSLPKFGDACVWKNHILFKAGNNQVMAWGASNAQIPTALYPIFYTSYTIGAISYNLSNFFVASSSGSNYQIAQATNYASGGYAYTKWFDVASSVVDKIKFYFRPLASNARIDLGLRYDQLGEATTTLYLGDINYADDANRYNKTFDINKELDNFSLYLDFTNSDTTNPIEITKIRIYGRPIERE